MKAMFSMFSQKIIGRSLQPSLLGWKLNHYLTRQRYNAPPLLADSPFDLDTCAAWVFSSMMMCNSSIICLTNLQFRLFLQLATEYVVRVSFGTALIASIVIVYTTIIALLSSRRYLDVNPCFSVVPLIDWKNYFFYPKPNRKYKLSCRVAFMTTISSTITRCWRYFFSLFVTVMKTIVEDAEADHMILLSHFTSAHLIYFGNV